jgi:hypothetical protein
MYIPPVSNVYLPLDVDAEHDLLPYCKLRRAHFKADELPVAYRGMEKRILASSTIIVYSPDSIIDAVEVPTNPDSARWEASIEFLTWEARFVTKASWWNPKTKGNTAERVLEHEQVHFAIAEREIQKVNAQAAQTNERIRVTGPTQVAVIAKMMRIVEERKQQVMDRVQAWQAKYDLETKNGTDWKAQWEWTQRLLK